MNIKYENNYCGVKLSVAGFDREKEKTLQRLGQIENLRISRLLI